MALVAVAKWVAGGQNKKTDEKASKKGTPKAPTSTQPSNDKSQNSSNKQGDGGRG